MTSETDVCNLALSFVGKPEITSLDERSTSAGWCRRAYSLARRDALTQSDWTFARAYAPLAATSDPAYPEYGYTSAKPHDAVRLLAVGRGDNPFRRGAAWQAVPYDLLNNSILTREAGAMVWYTRDVLDPDEWGPGFAEAVAYKLASLIAPQATGRPTDAVQLSQLYGAKWREAAVADAAQELTTWTRPEPTIVGGVGAMTAAEFAAKVDFPYDATMLWGPAGVGTPVSAGGGALPSAGAVVYTPAVDDGESDFVAIYEAAKDG